jgi:hypothetical protein
MCFWEHALLALQTDLNVRTWFACSSQRLPCALGKCDQPLCYALLTLTWAYIITVQKTMLSCVPKLLQPCYIMLCFDNHTCSLRLQFYRDFFVSKPSGQVS